MARLGAWISSKAAVCLLRVLLAAGAAQAQTLGDAQRHGVGRERSRASRSQRRAVHEPTGTTSATVTGADGSSRS